MKPIAEAKKEFKTLGKVFALYGGLVVWGVFVYHVMNLVCPGAGGIFAAVSPVILLIIGIFWAMPKTDPGEERLKRMLRSGSKGTGSNAWENEGFHE